MALAAHERVGRRDGEHFADTGERRELGSERLRSFAHDAADATLALLADLRAEPGALDEAHDLGLQPHGAALLQVGDHRVSSFRKATGSFPCSRASIRALPTIAPSAWAVTARKPAASRKPKPARTGRLEPERTS